MCRAGPPCLSLCGTDGRAKQKHKDSCSTSYASPEKKTKDRDSELNLGNRDATEEKRHGDGKRPPTPKKVRGKEVSFYYTSFATCVRTDSDLTYGSLLQPS
jgi:hypothetical protein